MDPFANDPYDSDSDHETNFRWPGDPGVSEHARALMRGDFEVSPLVPLNNPPMPEAASAVAKDHVPGIPSFSRGVPKLNLKKRKAEAPSTQGMAHAFEAAQHHSGEGQQSSLYDNGHHSTYQGELYQAPAEGATNMRQSAAADLMELKQSPVATRVPDEISHAASAASQGDMSRVFPPSALEKGNSDQGRSPTTGMKPPPPLLPRQPHHTVISGLQALSTMATSAQVRQEQQQNSSSVYVDSKQSTVPEPSEPITTKVEDSSADQC